MTVVYVLSAVVGGFIALMLGMRVLLAFKASKMRGKAAPSLSGKTGKYIGRGRPALFYFYSPHCGACAAMTPVIQKMSKKKNGVFPIDISRDMETARKFGVMATPTTILVRDGLVQDILIGPQPVSSLEQLAPA